MNFYCVWGIFKNTNTSYSCDFEYIQIYFALNHIIGVYLYILGFAHEYGIEVKLYRKGRLKRFCGY